MNNLVSVTSTNFLLYTNDVSFIFYQRKIYIYIYRERRALVNVEIGIFKETFQICLGSSQAYSWFNVETLLTKYQPLIFPNYFTVLLTEKDQTHQGHIFSLNFSNSSYFTFIYNIQTSRTFFLFSNLFIIYKLLEHSLYFQKFFKDFIKILYFQILIKRIQRFLYSLFNFITIVQSNFTKVFTIYMIKMNS